MYIPVPRSLPGATCPHCERRSASGVCAFILPGESNSGRDLDNANTRCNAALIAAGIPAAHVLRFHWAKVPDHSTLEEE